MIELETALKSHDWSPLGYVTRPELDRLMRLHAEPGLALWEQYCPWSTTNGGYIAWAKQ
jgi:hypothetical protein